MFVRLCVYLNHFSVIINFVATKFELFVNNCRLLFCPPCKDNLHVRLSHYEDDIALVCGFDHFWTGGVTFPRNSTVQRRFPHLWYNCGINSVLVWKTIPKDDLRVFTLTQC